MDINAEIASRVDGLTDRLLELRRTIHANPELAFEEVETAALVARTLRANGIACREGIAKTGIVAVIEGKKAGGHANSGKTVALRADLDCLPVVEDSGLPFASRNVGKSHCCGHDIHTTILVGAGIVLNQLSDRFAGRVKLIFQPAEEILAGAVKMIEEGVLDEPHVDAILGYHIWPALEAGTVGYHPGPAMASSDAFDVVLKGMSGHAAHPHLAIDPIAASAYFVSQLQTIVSREIAPTSPAVVTIGSIAGGTVRNVIPDHVTLKGTIRTLDGTARQHCEAALRRILEGIKTGMRVDCELSFMRMVPVLENNRDVLASVLESARAIIGPGWVRELPGASMGSEDFACFAERRPAAHLRIGSKVEGRPAMLHNGRFVANEEAIPTGALVMARAVLDLLES